MFACVSQQSICVCSYDTTSTNLFNSPTPKESVQLTAAAANSAAAAASAAATAAQTAKAAAAASAAAAAVAAAQIAAYPFILV